MLLDNNRKRFDVGELKKSVEGKRGKAETCMSEHVLWCIAVYPSVYRIHTIQPQAWARNEIILGNHDFRVQLALYGDFASKLD